MTTQIQHAIHPSPFDIMLPSGGIDHSEVEVEKILNEMGFFGEDYVVVHDKNGDLGSTLPVSTGILPASLDMFGIAQPVIEAKQSEQAQPQTVVSSDPPKMQQPQLVPASVVPTTTSKEAPVSNGRKRKSPSSGRHGKPQITEVERRERNRQHAKKSRLRKKSLTGVLEQSANDLRAENQRLRELIYAKLGEQKANEALAARRELAHTSFIASLKQPSNRVLDDASVGHLKSLRRSLNSSSSSSDEAN